MRLKKIFLTIALTAGAILAAKPAASAEAQSAIKRPVSIVTGTVAGIDILSNVIIIQTKTGLDTLAISADCTFAAPHRSITIGDIKTGRKVAISCFDENGKPTARHIAADVPATIPPPRK